MEKKARTILQGLQFKLTLDRLCHQLIEEYQSFENTCLIGVQDRGARFAERLHANLQDIVGIPNIEFGKLDVTFYRDDFRRRSTPLIASKTEMDFSIEGKKVVLIDDVLYSGRTIRAALDALQDYGRPKTVQLVALVDRRFNRHLPIQADYIGITVDALNEAYVRVDWEGLNSKKDQILLFPKKEPENLK